MQDQPEYLNEHYHHHKKLMFENVDFLSEEILKGNRVALSKAITLIESENENHRVKAAKLLSNLLPHSGNSIRIGITGVPGAGKSTFIETLGKSLTTSGKKLAVLAIDPTSTMNKGSILGDKTRMEELSVDPNAFIRPSPSGGTLGGVARKTKETMLLCEAAGFDTVIIETVGVGQSETDVHEMVDVFLLLLIAGAGDELQGIKRGIMEMADILVINKDDGENTNNVIRAKQQTKAALHLFPPTASGWIPQVMSCSSLEKKGISAIWLEVEKLITHLRTKNLFQTKRSEQALFWMHQTIREELYFRFYHQANIKTQLIDIEELVKSGQLNPFEAAQQLLDSYQK